MYMPITLSKTQMCAQEQEVPAQLIRKEDYFTLFKKKKKSYYSACFSFEKPILFLTLREIIPSRFEF